MYTCNQYFQVVCESHPSATRPYAYDERVRRSWVNLPLEQRRFVYLKPECLWEVSSSAKIFVTFTNDDIPTGIRVLAQVCIVRRWTEGWTTFNVEYEATAWWTHHLKIFDISYHIAIRLNVEHWEKGLSLLEGETCVRTITALNEDS